MRIGIVGNYGNNNQGDEAILQGVITQLENTFSIDESKITVFTNRPKQTQQKFGVNVEKLYLKKKTAPMTLIATILHHKRTIRNLDLLVIGGGGILMDLYTHGLVLFGMYAKIAKYARTTYVIYGVGAGPINSRIGKLIIRSLVKHAALVTVRDTASKALLEDIGVNQKINVIADPAFSLQSPKQQERDYAHINIGVTAVPYYHSNYWPTEDKAKYNNYIHGMAHNFDQLVENDPRIKLSFFSTKYPQDAVVTKDIKKLMKHKERCVIYDKSLDQHALLEKINKQDLIIGTRLHSLILALVTEKPIIGIAYHHKVKDFMKDIGCEDKVIPIEDLHLKSDYFLKMYREMSHDWMFTKQRFQTISSQIKDINRQGMELVRDIVTT